MQGEKSNRQYSISINDFGILLATKAPTKSQHAIANVNTSCEVPLSSLATAVGADFQPGNGGWVPLSR